MKKLLPLAPFILVLTPLILVARSARPSETRAAAQDQLDARVSVLESELALQKKRNDETRALVEQTLTYLDAQGQAAKTLLGALDESEREGFTPGINYRSREILLAGLRAYWGGSLQGLPKLPASKDKAAPAPQPRQ